MPVARRDFLNTADATRREAGLFNSYVRPAAVAAVTAALK